MIVYQSFLSHSFDVNLATQLGSVDLAILVNHFVYWINKNIDLGINCHDGRTWTYQTREEIAAHFPYWSSDQVRRMTDKLVKLGILRKGNYNKKNIDKTLWYAFENQKNFTTGKSANSTGKIAKPIPHSKTKDIIDLGIKDPQPEKPKVDEKKNSASYKTKSKTLEASQRWRLSEEQTKVFNWLKSKQIDAEDKKLCFWAKSFTFERLKNVYEEAIRYKARSLRTYMSKLLDEKRQVNNSNIEQNKQYATDFLRANNWNDLKINLRYATFPMGPDTQEITFDMAPSDFKRILGEKYENSVGY